MKLTYRKKDFNPKTIHNVELWDGDFVKGIHDSYLNGWGFTIVHVATSEEERILLKTMGVSSYKIDYTIHYVDTEVFSGMTKCGRLDMSAVEEIRSVVGLHLDNISMKESSIKGIADIKNLIKKVRKPVEV